MEQQQPVQAIESDDFSYLQAHKMTLIHIYPNLILSAVCHLLSFQKVSVGNNVDPGQTAAGSPIRFKLFALMLKYVCVVSNYNRRNR